MGMSASQVRFLSLQSRKNDIGCQLTALASKKRSLAHDMKDVTRHYDNAMNQKVLKWSNDSGASYNTLSYDLMMRPNELSTNVPYIISSAKNEVVLNNDSILDRDGNPIGLSYIDIAEMISTYSGYNGDGTINYNNTDNITTNANGEKIGGKAIKDAYYIPKSDDDFSFKKLLRYDIFEKMGIITGIDVKKQIGLLTELYGSEEAQKTGVYPVGSAWGDYYLACANLEAYNEFLDNQQSLNSSSTFHKSINTAENQKVLNNNHILETNITDYSLIDGQTKINQQATASSTGSISHVDFNAYTTTNDAGKPVTTYKYLTAEDGTITTNTSFDDNLGTIGDDNLTDGFAYTYTTNVTSNGIEYNYHFDDLWYIAKTNYQNAGNTLSYELSRIGATGQDDVIETYENIVFSTFGEEKNKTKNKIESVLDEVIKVLNYNNITDLNQDMMQKAKEATVNLFINNPQYKKEASSGSPSQDWIIAEQKAKENANGTNSVFGYKIDDTMSACIDLTCLFNTFMTYYSQMTQGQAPTTTIELSHEVFSKGANKYFADVKFSNDLFSNGYGYVTEYYLNEHNTGGYEAFYTKKITNERYDENGNERVCAYVKKSSSSFLDKYDSSDHGEPESRSSIEYYYYDEDPNDPLANSVVSYNTGGINWDMDGDGVPETTIYGIYQEGSDIYYFKDKTSPTDLWFDACEPEYPNGHVVDISKATKYVAPTSQNPSVYIAETEANSKYDISLNGFVNDQQNYKKTLTDRVNAAWDRIKNLQDELKGCSIPDSKITDYYDALFLRIAEQGWVQDEQLSNTKQNHSSYLSNKLLNNDYFVTVCNDNAEHTGYEYICKQSSSVNKLFAVNDTDAEDRALSQYETDKTLISTKERRIDTEMQKLETEQEAINTEMENVKKIVDQNVADTFKTFA